MIKKNQRLLNLFSALLDGALIVLSFALASWLWLDVLKQDAQNYASLHAFGNRAFAWLLGYVLVMLLLLALLGVYNTTRVKGLRKELVAIFGANVAGALIAGVALFMLRLEDFSRGVLIVFTLLSIFFLSAKRLTLRLVLTQLRKHNFNIKHVYVVGTGALARKYALNIRKNSQLGFHIDGFFGDEESDVVSPVIGGMDVFESKLADSRIDEVVIAISPEDTHWVTPTIALCEKYGTKVAIIPFYNDIIPSHPTIDIIGDTKLINLRSNPLDNIGYAAIKRLGDVLVSAILLILLSPILLAVYIGVKTSSPGPALFKQKRVGRNKKLFYMLKFRSMRLNTEQDTAWSQDKDPRRTKFGSFIRKFSLDELPQLINVLRGDMSLIGPRPEIPFFVEQFMHSVPLYMVKHQVRPGMTGWAQVNGLRGDTSIQKRIEHDIWYIEHWSIGLDIKILFLTAFGGWVNKESLTDS